MRLSQILFRSVPTSYLVSQPSNTVGAKDRASETLLAEEKSESVLSHGITNSTI